MIILFVRDCMANLLKFLIDFFTVTKEIRFWRSLSQVGTIPNLEVNFNIVLIGNFRSALNSAGTTSLNEKFKGTTFISLIISYQMKIISIFWFWKLENYIHLIENYKMNENYALQIFIQTHKFWEIHRERRICH
jgi:hypothetical protein